MRTLRREPRIAGLLLLLLVGVASLVLTQLWQIAVITFFVVQALWMLWLASHVLANRVAVQESREEQQRLFDANAQTLAELTRQVAELVGASRVEPNNANLNSDRAEVLTSESTMITPVAGEDFASTIPQDESHSSDSYASPMHSSAIGTEEVLSILREISDRQIEATDAAKEYATLLQRTKHQLNRSSRRQIETYGMLEFLEGRLVARMDQFLDEAIREFHKNRGEISTLAHRFDALEWSSKLGGQTEAIRSGQAEDHSAYLYYLSYQIPREIEAAQQLQRVYQPEGLMPLLGGWALTPSGTLDIVNAISAHEAATVVECGSGTSTLWFAIALRERGTGHVYALEHDPVFAEKTRESLAAQGLTRYATVIDAPIVEHRTEQGTVNWYEISGLSDVPEIDVLVVDGPPKALGHLRDSAMTLLSARFSKRAEIFADDVNRPSEQTMISNWLVQFDPLQTAISSTPVQAHLIWDATEKR